MLPVDDNRSGGIGKRGDSLANVVREEKGEVFIMVSKEEMAKYLNLNEEEVKGLLVDMDSELYDKFTKIIKVD